MTDTPKPRNGRTSRFRLVLSPAARLLPVPRCWSSSRGCNPVRDPAAIPSALIGQPAPAFDLPALAGLGVPGLTRADLDGQVTIVNVFASWCVPCRQEHPVLEALAKTRQGPHRRHQLQGQRRQRAPLPRRSRQPVCGGRRRRQRPHGDRLRRLWRAGNLSSSMPAASSATR